MCRECELLTTSVFNSAVLDNLEELSRQATPGKRVRDHSIICAKQDGVYQILFLPTQSWEGQYLSLGKGYKQPNPGKEMADARFVTALDPETVQELIRGYREYLTYRFASKHPIDQ